MAAKTKSLWGTAPSRYYRWLRRAESGLGPELRIAVLGCSDGKFVLPAARRGIHVVAVDVDAVSLYGGTKQGADGCSIEMPGLIRRLEAEGLRDRVIVLNEDLATVRVERPCDLVFISGAIQYAINRRHSMADLIANVKALVAPGGRVSIEYMLPVEARHQGLENYPSAEIWTEYFSTPGWTVTSNWVAPVGKDRRTDVRVRAKHKYTQWGYLHAERAPETAAPVRRRGVAARDIALFPGDLDS